MANAKLTEALQTLTAGKAEAAELQARLDTITKKNAAAEKVLFDAVKALGEAQVIEGQVVSIKTESKVTNAVLGYKELVTAITAYDPKMGEEAALLAQTALEDKKKANEANPKIIEKLDITPLSTSWANTNPAAAEAGLKVAGKVDKAA